MDKNQRVRIVVNFFAILYLGIGLGDLIGGASFGSRFYIFDDLLIRFIGFILMLSSIGLFFRKEISRKGIIIALSLSIVEILIGVPKEINTIELIVGIIIFLIIYVPGLIYFSVSKNKEYFSWYVSNFFIKRNDFSLWNTI